MPCCQKVRFRSLDELDVLDNQIGVPRWCHSALRAIYEYPDIFNLFLLSFVQCSRSYLSFWTLAQSLLHTCRTFDPCRLICRTTRRVGPGMWSACLRLSITLTMRRRDITSQERITTSTCAARRCSTPSTSSYPQCWSPVSAWYRSIYPPLLARRSQCRCPSCSHLSSFYR